jgi:hypothetical protein
MGLMNKKREIVIGKPIRKNDKVGFYYRKSILSLLTFTDFQFRLFFINIDISKECAKRFRKKVKENERLPKNSKL